MQNEMLCVLLDTLMEKEMIAKATYDGAVNVVNSHVGLPEFFRYPVCCCAEEYNNGCSKDQE